MHGNVNIEYASVSGYRFLLNKAVGSSCHRDATVKRRRLSTGVKCHCSEGRNSEYPNDGRVKQGKVKKGSVECDRLRYVTLGIGGRLG